MNRSPTPNPNSAPYDFWLEAFLDVTPFSAYLVLFEELGLFVNLFPGLDTASTTLESESIGFFIDKLFARLIVFVARPGCTTSNTNSSSAVMPKKSKPSRHAGLAPLPVELSALCPPTLKITLGVTLDPDILPHRDRGLYSSTPCETYTVNAPTNDPVD